MINKKQINRFLCIKLVELFNLTSYDYTWSGVDTRYDMSKIIDELYQLGPKSPLTAEQKSLLLAAIQTPAKFMYYNNEEKSSGSQSFPTLFWAWDNGLNKIISSSVVSLITESIAFQTGTVFTEKTAYALLGRTFPLWIGGGVNHAQRFEEMGFDVFHDVIDHSYQSYSTLIERCYYAFERNLKLLTDYDYASQLRETHMDRLERNQQLMLSHQVGKFCKQEIKKWPVDLQQAIQHELKYWILEK